MKFGYTILYVSDVSQTVAFYEQAFALKRRFIHESGCYAEMETGATALAFAQQDFVMGSHPFRAVSSNEPAPAMEVGLVTNDVEAAYQRAVASGAVPVSEPHAKPWGQIVSYVRDCNGFLVEICSEVG